MLIALFVVVGLSLLILGHEAGHFFVAKFFKLRVDEFGFGFPPRMFAWRPRNRRTGKPSETEYSFNWLPFGGFVKIAGENDALSLEGAGIGTGAGGELGPMSGQEKRRHFAFRSAWVKSAVILAGVAVNFLIGWMLITLVLMIGSPKAVVITEVERGSPAAEAGFLAGDVVKDYTESKTFIEYVASHRGEEVSFTVIRGGKDITLSAAPRAEVAAGKGALGVFLAEVGEERQNFFTALWMGFARSLEICALVFQTFYFLIRDLFLRGSLLADVVGPVGIFSVAQETGRIGWVYLVGLMSIISLNLAVVNTIPFPALDGGRFVMILIEKIKGSPLSRRVEAAVNIAGFAFLIGLMLLLTFRDVGNLL